MAINEALDVAMATDGNVFLLGEDIADAVGRRVQDHQGPLDEVRRTTGCATTPIAEQAIVGAAVGAAIAGKRPVAEIMFMDFLAVCMDQVANHAAKLRYMSGGQTTVPMTIRTSAGAGMGFGAQHCELLEAWFAHTPGLKVVAPSTPADAKGLLLTSIHRRRRSRAVHRAHVLMYARPAGPVPEADVRVPLGGRGPPARAATSPDLLWQAGARLPRGGRSLAEEGVDVEVIDLRTLAPLDEDDGVRVGGQDQGRSWCMRP